MSNTVTQYLADYIEKSSFSAESISRALGIPKQKLIPSSEEMLTAEEFLRLCSYLRIRPESIPLYNISITYNNEPSF